MKKLSLLIVLLAFFATSGLFAQTVWKHDPNHSKVGFTVTHFSISDITGYFTSFDVTVTAGSPFVPAAFNAGSTPLITTSEPLGTD